MAPEDPEHHIAGTTTRLIVTYVRDRAGDAGVMDLLARANDRRHPVELESEHTWSSYDQTIALFEAASDLLGDPAVGRRVGEEVIRQRVGTPIAPVLVALGSPSELCREITRTSAKFQTVGDAEAEEIDDTHAVITFTLHDPFRRNRLHCDYMIGLLSQIPVLFSQPPAEVAHEECQVDGAARCRYEVRWPAQHLLESSAREQRIELLEAHNQVLVDQIHDLQSTAADLVSADDVTTVLTRIASRAAGAVRAPRYVLALRGDDGRPAGVHWHGMRAADARAVAGELLSVDALEGDDRRLVVEVASAQRAYGRLAALYDQGGRFFPEEVRLLRAYAGHAAAALDAAAALEYARWREATASGLLAMAHQLSDASGAEEIGATVASSLPGIVGGDRAALFRWDGDARTLSLLQSPAVEAGSTGDLIAFVDHLAGTPALVAMLADPRPRLYPAGVEGDDAAAVLGASQVAVVPAISIGQLLGVVVTAWSEETAPPPEREVSERLSGVADQVATALSKADLLELIRHQATHDALTGLPNRVLFTDRTDRALAAAGRSRQQVAIMFLDLDRFKGVNDSLGHSVGNELLCLVTERLVAVVRECDTVARMGGDEFTVLLPAVAGREGAAAVAEELRAALEAPFRIGGTDVRTSASIGIAISPDDGTGTDALLTHADLAMYQAKGRGRDTWCFADVARASSDVGGQRRAATDTTDA